MTRVVACNNYAVADTKHFHGFVSSQSFTKQVSIIQQSFLFFFCVCCTRMSILVDTFKRKIHFSFIIYFFMTIRARRKTL